MKRCIVVILLLSLFIQPIYAQEYGEDSDALGQFVDEYVNLDNVTVIEDLIRNGTLNVIELNYTTRVGAYDNFEHYIEFDIDYNRIESNLSSFPVLLNISIGSGINDDDVSAIFDEVGESYLKIAITNLTLVTEYYIEVESWDSVGEIAYLWFSPDVSSLENSSFRLHYDITHANNTGRVGIPGSVVVQNVWNGNYSIVHHLSGDNRTDTLDSTSNNMDATTEFGDTIYGITGQINGGVDFDGNDDIQIGDNAILEPSQLTLEVWVKTTSTQQFAGFIDRRTGNTEGYEFDYPAVDGKLRFLIEFGGGLNQEIKSSVAINDDVWHYVVGTYDETNLKIYVDGVETGTIAENDNIAYGAHNFFMPGDQVSTHRAVTEEDEVRLSKIARNADWINGSYYSGIDNLVYWHSVSSTSGYENDGYFLTEDYLNYTTGSSLVLLTNSTIPISTSITVQFSNDNSSWVDHEGNVGSTSLIAGFYSIDLRDLNYTDIYSMYNFTGTQIDTPRLYQSRLVTTWANTSIVVGNVTFQNVTGEWISYNLTSISTLIGTLDSGNLASTLDIDSNEYNVSEVVGNPGFLVSFNWTDVNDSARCLWITMYVLYDGNLVHDIHIELYNHTSLSWIEIGVIDDDIAYEWHNVTTYSLRIPNDFVNGTGSVFGRLNHNVAGNINHDLSIEYLKLLAFIPSSVAVIGGINSSIIIMIIFLCTLALVLLWRFSK